jgi:hypothetical protein
MYAFNAYPLEIAITLRAETGLTQFFIGFLGAFSPLISSFFVQTKAALKDALCRASKGCFGASGSQGWHLLYVALKAFISALPQLSLSEFAI